MPDVKKLPSPPNVHRMEEDLRVCDPERTDHTKTIETWRIFKIMAEFVEGFKLLRKYRLAVTFFGSARLQPEDTLYREAALLAARLAKSGFTIVTGGASGIMEAASKGAYEAGGQSVGLNIQLPTEQRVNTYLTDGLTFNYFFTRKVMMSFASEVYIFFPGGFGTLDEFFEILTLVQTGKIKKIPIILYDRKYWEPLIAYFREHLLTKYRTIGENDTDLFHLADSVDKAYDEIMELVRC